MYVDYIRAWDGCRKSDFERDYFFFVSPKNLCPLRCFEVYWGVGRPVGRSVARPFQLYDGGTSSHGSGKNRTSKHSGEFVAAALVVAEPGLLLLLLRRFLRTESFPFPRRTEVEQLGEIQKGLMRPLRERFETKFST